MSLSNRKKPDHSPPLLGMILKGYPRISESFISQEILLLESLGVNVEIYSLRQPREHFCHDHVKYIQAPVTYLPEYVLPRWPDLLRSNTWLARRLGVRYARCFLEAVGRAWKRRKTATLRHFLQAGHLASHRLCNPAVRHLHAHFCHTPTSVAFFAHRLTGLPYSFTAHAKDIYTSEPEQLVRKIMGAQFVVTCTEFNARTLESLVGGRSLSSNWPEAPQHLAPPIHTVYHGIDTDFFAYGPVPPPVPPFRILSVGRLVPKKGYDDLLKALKMLVDARMDFTFTHVGSGEGKEATRALIHKLGLESRVRMLGTLPHSEVIELYRSSHLFVLACKVASDGDRDGIPNVLVEAMAMGLPVISTRVSAIPELVEDGRTGVLVPPEDPPALARAMADVLLRPDGRESRLLSARRHVEDHFDNRRCVARLALLFKEALGPS